MQESQCEDSVRVQRLLVRSLQPSLITPDVTSCMACVCVCLLPCLRWPGFSPAVACLAQSQGLHCLYNQASLDPGRATTRTASVPVDVCFTVNASLKLKRLIHGEMKMHFVLFQILLFLNQLACERDRQSNPNNTLPYLRLSRLWEGDGAYVSVRLLVCV